jgi:protein-S-isoprenylcysteine O-methyltransferase Ste14
MNNDTLYALVPLGLSFIAYFVIHSLLASLRFKRWVHHRWPGLMHAYRLTYNLLAILLLIPLLWFMQQSPGPLMWQWSGLLGWVMKGLTAVAVLGFVWSLKSYDNLVFLGWSQWRNRHTAASAEGNEQLHISTLHRFVRHPWYFFILVILWTQDLHLAQLLVYGLITIYLLIGSRLEERKLIAHFGQAYTEYCRQVPGLFPLPWQWLDKEEARRLEQLAAEEKR